MDNSALVSVVVPVYNVENYLERCVDSIVKQTFSNLEIILVDDGSVDNSGVLCDEYKRKDDRIKVIHKQNGGLSDARNKGIDIAAGEYITFVDSDDFIHEKYVETLLERLLQCNAQVAICGEQRFEAEDDLIELQPTYGSVVYGGIEALEMMCYQKKIANAAWGKLYRKELFDTVRFPVGKLFEDLGTIYKILFQAQRVVLLKERLYYYLQRPGSIMNSAFSIKKMDRITISREILEFVEKYSPSIVNAAYSRLFISSVQVLREIPYEKNKYSKEIAIIAENIKKYRKGVLMDPKAKLVNRMIALFCYLPLRFLKKFGGIYKKYEKVVYLVGIRKDSINES